MENKIAITRSQSPKWKISEFGDIFNFENKSRNKASDGKEIGKYKFFTSSNLQNKFIDFFDYDGEYLIFGTGGNPSIHYVNEKFSTSTDCLASKINNNSILTKFIYYYLAANMQLLEAGFKGAGLRHISKGYIRKIKIPYPENIEKQKKIVAILEKAEETKRLRSQADELTNQLLQSVFLEMFGDPIKNPKGWEMARLGELGEWTSGGTPSRLKTEYFQGNIPWFTAGELNDSYLSDSKERITEEALEVSSAKLFQKGTMLIGMYDSAAFKMGLLMCPASSNQACAAFIPKPEKLESLFALQLFRSMKPSFLSKRRGVRQKNLSQSIIKNFEVPLPPISHQKNFSQIVEGVEKIRQNQLQSYKEIDNLFNVFMQKAFKGELTA